jgi:hypothetical protein
MNIKEANARLTACNGWDDIARQLALELEALDKSDPHYVYTVLALASYANWLQSKT